MGFRSGLLILLGLAVVVARPALAGGDEVVSFSSPAVIKCVRDGGLAASPAPSGGLSVTFSSTGDWPGKGFRLMAPDHYTATDWTGFATCVFELENVGGKDAQVEIMLRRVPGSWKEREIANFNARITAGKRAFWRMSLLPWRTTKAWAWPSQPGIREFGSWGRIKPAYVTEIGIHVRGDDPSTLVLRRMYLEEPAPAKRWVDQYGQLNFRDWPGKIKSDEDILTADRLEEQELVEPPSYPERDEYQAWTGAKPRKATGFFRTEKIKGRWWFVAPNGNLYYSVGIDVIVCGIDPLIDDESRDAYSWYPPKDGSFAGAGACPYRANLIRKWGGKEYQDRWRERAIKRQHAWGFTGLGNWAISNWGDDPLFERARLPYVTVGPPDWDMKIPKATSKIHDVYHPDFEAEAFRTARMLAKYARDPWCLGHFVNNELNWGNLPHEVLELDPTAPAKARWLKMLERKYEYIDRLNLAWGTAASCFEDLRWPDGENGRPEANKKARRDLAAFRGEFADRYYSVWYRAVRAADPSHLVLGSRLHDRFEEVVRACGRHMDAVSFNNYAVGPDREEFDRYYRMTKKPFIIGEYGHFSLDTGLLTTAVPVADVTERGVGYRYYTEQLASLPYFVGGHYFQYLDEPVTGRFDRETAFNGFVNVADVPYAPLVRAAEDTNARIYSVHAGTLAPFDRKPRR